MTARIIQQNPNGCGLACVAMIVGQSYVSVMEKAILLIEEIAENGFRTTSDELKKILNSFGFKAHPMLRCSLNSRKKLPDLCILKINMRLDAKSVTHWHWVVFIRDGQDEYILDPNGKRSKQRRDWGRMKAVSYMAITN